MGRLGALAVFALLVGCGDDGSIGGDAGAIPCATNADCDDGLPCNGEEVCNEDFCAQGSPPSCDDGMACTRDRCIDSRGGCVHDPEDLDRDGVPSTECGGDDCDDADPTRSPAVNEVCDGVDEDCDGTVDDGFATVAQWPDLDGEGFGDGTMGTSDFYVGTPGYATQNGDCNDRNGNVFSTQGAYFVVPPCDEIAEERTCTLTGGGIGCRRGGTCVAVPFEYDCSANVEANVPGASCSFTGPIQCFSSSDCTPAWLGTAYDFKPSNPPCGQLVDEAIGCECSGSTSCGVETPIFTAPTQTVACH